MSHPFYHIKRRRKGPPTVRYFNNNKKITKLISITKTYSNAMKIIKVIPLKLRNFSCCLSFLV